MNEEIPHTVIREIITQPSSDTQVKGSKEPLESTRSSQAEEKSKSDPEAIADSQSDIHHVSGGGHLVDHMDETFGSPVLQNSLLNRAIYPLDSSDEGKSPESSDFGKPMSFQLTAEQNEGNPQVKEEDEAVNEISRLLEAIRRGKTTQPRRSSTPTDILAGIGSPHRD